MLILGAGCLAKGWPGLWAPVEWKRGNRWMAVDVGSFHAAVLRDLDFAPSAVGPGSERDPHRNRGRFRDRFDAIDRGRRSATRAVVRPSTSTARGGCWR